MACNVCGEENGWAENPIVYCDGNDGHCSVAVHQACYGITSIPSTAWLCGKCVSFERKAKVRCELCPSKDGAFKRTNNNGFAHVVCSLYIPEVQFGNVTTMEPIILSSIPADRFHKSCYICEDRGKEAKAKVGACMPCNKTGCKYYFHVTCGQIEGLLCEQASSSDDSVKYCGYCKHHCQKKRKDPNIKFIPKFVPERRVERGDSSPEKKSHHNSDTSKPPKKKQKFYGTSDPVDSDAEPPKQEKVKRKRLSSSSKPDLSTSSNKHNSSKESNNSVFSRGESDDESSSDSSSIAPSNRKKSRENPAKNAFESDTDDDEDEQPTQRKRRSSESEKKRPKKVTPAKAAKAKEDKSAEKPSKEAKKPKKKKEADPVKASKSSADKEESAPASKPSKSVEEKGDAEKSSTKTSSQKEISNGSETALSDELALIARKREIEKEIERELNQQQLLRSQMPKQHFDLPEIVKPRMSLITEEEQKSQKPIHSFEELLERQWIQSSQFLMEQSSQFYDIASLVSCLHKLKSENRSLDEKLKALTQRRDYLMTINARLAIPCPTLNAMNGLDSWEGNGNISNLLANGNAIAGSGATSNGNSAPPHASANESLPTANLFANYPNQNVLAQANFSSIHNAATNTSSPSPTTGAQSKAVGNSSQGYFGALTNSLTNVNNPINSSLSNQSFGMLNNGKSLDMNSNLNSSFYDQANSLKQQRESAANSFHFAANNSLYQAVNGQLLNSNLSGSMSGNLSGNMGSNLNSNLSGNLNSNLNSNLNNNLNNNLTSASNTSSPSKLSASFNNSLIGSNPSTLSPQVFQSFLQQNQQNAFSLSQQSVPNSVLGQSKR